jgi:hypothetical protein
MQPNWAIRNGIFIGPLFIMAPIGFAALFPQPGLWLACMLGLLAIGIKITIGG